MTGGGSGAGGWGTGAGGGGGGGGEHPGVKSAGDAIRGTSGMDLHPLPFQPAPVFLLTVYQCTRTHLPHPPPPPPWPYTRSLSSPT
jgi:hypothetical protein